MSLDISHILNGWSYKPGEVTARRVRGDDGRDKIQLRLDLGLLQMEASGRPDGQRPHGCESLLAHYQQQLQRHREEHSGDEVFVLDEQACELLRAEAVMYYHRYLAEFILEDFKAVERDAMRNLRLMDFCKAYAAEEADRHILEQYRPYVMMMCVRARARIALGENRPKAALAALKTGIEAIGRFYRRTGREELVEKSGEIIVLQAMAKDVEARIPVDPAQRLRKQLDKAVQAEHYEEAAAIRDRLRRMTGEDQRPMPPII
ncbi:MAG: UvrB/UvrC motif-containing protein [Planctomycetota bacterium]|nr:UvrB/UvrC motif-containing protein [Planctomycetota bacterium]